MLHGLQIVGLGKVALGRVALCLADHRRADRILELVFQFAQALLGVGVGLGRGRVGVNNQVELARQVVDHGQFFALQQQDVRTAQAVGRAGFFQLLFNVAHRVITEIACQTTTKTRQARPQGDLEALLVSGHKIQRVAGGSFDHRAITHDFGLGISAKAAGAQQGARGQANKTVAAKSLTTDHGFEQKAVLAAVT